MCSLPAEVGRTAGNGLLLRGMVAVAVAALLVALSGWTVPASAAEGLDVHAETIYRLDPDAGVVHVVAEVRLTNTLSSRRRGAYIETPYFDSFSLPVVGPVADVSARSTAGGPLSVDVDEEGELDVVVVDLSPNLLPGAPQNVTVEFELPSQPIRSADLTRVNPAFASWVAVAVGDPGQAEVIVDVPESFAALLATDMSWTSSRSQDRRVYRVGPLEDPDAAVFFVTARDDEALTRRELALEGTDVIVRAWPDDGEWEQFTSQLLQRGIPVMETLIGRALPEDVLTVMQASGGYHLGYAGLYDAASSTVEIGERLDELVMLHELSHAWFNRDLFADRWIYEGLAEAFANRAMDELNKSPEPARPIDPDARGAVPLNSWSSRFIADPEGRDIEEFAYGASYTLVDLLLDEIGLESMQQVITTAMDGAIAYQADGAPEPVRLHPDWRYFYDLLELVGGSEEAYGLFTAHVVTDDQAAALARRTETLDRYDELIETRDGWAAPLVVRNLMAHWDFERADDAITKARAHLERIAEIDASLRPTGIGLPDPMEESYEQAAGFADLDKSLSALEEAVPDLLTLHDQHSGFDPIRSLGLVGVPDHFEAALGAFQNGDLDDFRTYQASASRALERARLLGMLWLALGLATVSGAAYGVRRHRRRHRGDHREGPHATP